jgi:DNA polymerase III subunit epsilon
MREIVLDTETTGLNPLEGHRIVEIGAVEILHQVPTGRTFHRLLNPERDIPEEAAAVHGHTADSLREEPLFSEVVDELFSFLGDAPLVIHNAEFDLGFLNAELSRLGRKQLPTERIVDTLAIARRKHPGSPNSLDALCDRYRINRSHRERHGALLDANILVDVYCELSGGRQRSFLLSQPTATTALKAVGPRKEIEPRRLRIRSIDAGEIVAHDRFVGSLGADAVWLRYVSPQPRDG